MGAVGQRPHEAHELARASSNPLFPVFHHAPSLYLPVAEVHHKNIQCLDEWSITNERVGSL